MKVYCAEPGTIIAECLEKEIMKVYCAEIGEFRSDWSKITVNGAPKFNILFSYYYTKHPEIYFPFSKSILVDSGAFTLQQTKKPDYDDYFKKYSSFVKKYCDNKEMTGFFELDIPDQVGYDKVKYYRNKLFNITPKIIPVWHKSLGISEFKNLCDEYEYIGVSCVNDRSIKKEDYIKFVKYAHQHNTKIHGLGMLRPQILSKVPFDSVDGTSWFKGARFGKYNGKKIKSEYTKENRTKLVFLELMEHIRFQEKMEKKWEWYHND